MTSINIPQKIIARENLQALVDSLRQTETLVTTNGAFDILHAGHVRSLELAASYGTKLFVGLNSDASVKCYKSPDRPIIAQDDRAYILAALACVDYVTIFDEDDPRELLKIIKPHVHVKSRSGYKGIEEQVIKDNGGQIILIDDIPGISTTTIIERIRRLSKTS